MQANEFSRKTPSLEDEGIDLVELFRVLFARKILISRITLIFAIGALVYVTFFYTPIYKATATIQVKESDFFEHKINLLTSRHVIGEVVDTLKLYIVGKPKLIFTVGDRLYREHELSTDGAPALEKLNTFRYSWSGGQIEVVNLEVPNHLIDKSLTLRLKESNQIVLQHNKNVLLQGKVGEELSANGVVLNVQSFSALPGTEFTIIRKDRLQTIMDIKDDIEVSEIESGIFSLSYESKNLQMATAMLDQVIKVHVRQYTDSNLAEVQKSLDLINKKIPELEKHLKEAKQKFDDRVMQYESTDLNKSVIANLNPGIISGIDQNLLSLKLSRIELSHRMKTDAVDQLSVIDYAVVDPLNPVSPPKSVLVVLMVLLGFIVACAYVLIVRAIHSRLEDPSEVDSIGTPVHTTIPQRDKLPKK